MCHYSYTDHLGCGHRLIHAKLPCPNAFDSSLPQCDLKDCEQGETVDTECPECEPAFDNQGSLELRPKGRIMQEVYRPTKIKLTFTRRSTLSEKSPSPEMEDDTHHFTGDLAQIDQQHNQFRHLNPYDLTSHKINTFRSWNNDPEQPGPGREEDYTDPSHNLPPFVKHTGLAVIPTEPWSQPEHNTNHVVSRPRSRGQLATLTSEERRRSFYGYKITRPEPPPSPSTPICETRSFRIKHGRILKARQITLSTSQRKAMARAGYKDVRSLCVKTRHRSPPQDSTSDESSTSVRQTRLSPSQRKVMARAGYHNVRKLTVVRRRRQDPSSEAEF